MVAESTTSSGHLKQEKMDRQDGFKVARVHVVQRHEDAVIRNRGSLLEGVISVAIKKLICERGRCRISGFVKDITATGIEETEDSSQGFHFVTSLQCQIDHRYFYKILFIISYSVPGVSLSTCHSVL